jgi:hypothetical protein
MDLPETTAIPNPNWRPLTRSGRETQANPPSQLTSPVTSVGSFHDKQNSDCLAGLQ